MKLTARLVLIFLFLSLLPLTVVGLLGYTNARSDLAEAAEERLVTVNELKRQELERWLDETQHDLQSLAQRPLVVSNTETLIASAPDSSAFLMAQDDLLVFHLIPRQQLDESIATLYVLEPSAGIVLVATDPTLEGQNLAESELFIQGLQESYLDPPTMSGDRLRIDISTPIVNGDGTVIGVLAATLEPALFNEILASISGISQTQESYLINTANQIVTPLRLDPEGLHRTLHTQAADACLAGQNGMGTYPDYRNVDVIGVYRWLPDLQACLITEIDAGEAHAPARDLQFATHLTITIAAIVVAVLAVLMARDLVLPIRQLTDGAAEIGRGNLAYRLDSERTDELGRLAQVFNLMAEDLSAGDRALREANESLEQQVEERTAALLASLEELGYSEERYRTLFDNVPTGLYRTTVDGRLLEANQALVDMLGYPDKKTLLEVNARSLYVEDDYRDEQVRRLKDKSVLREFTYQLRCYDGSAIWVEDTMRVIRDEPGEIRQFEGSLQDITERRQAANREREQRQFAEALTAISAALNSTLNLDQVLDHILNAIEQVVPHDSAYILLIRNGNLSLVRSQGRRARQVMAHMQLASPITIDTHDIQTMIKTGGPLIIDDVRQFAGWVVLDGQEWVRGHLGAPIVVNGEFIGFIGVDSDQAGIYTELHAQRLQAFAHQAAIAIFNARLFEQIKEHRDNLGWLVAESTLELRQTKEQIEAILNNNPDSILLLLPNGQIQMSNPAYQHLFGMEADEAAEVSLLDVIPAEEQPALLNALSQVSLERRNARLALVAERRDGSPVDLDLALAPLEEDGDLLSIVCSLRDITGLKDAERMKDAFMSMAAHELRTPLTSIRGFSEILLNRSLEHDQQQRYLTFISEQAAQLSSIIDDLLDVARLKAGRGMRLTLQTTDLAKIIRDMVEPIAETTPHLTFKFTGLDDALDVTCDRKRIGQVLLNLVSNAVKYSPGGGEIAIAGQLDGDHVILCVTDPGIGMTPDQLARIFEPFYRADTSNTALEGTGLGLALCRMIVEAHGGMISVTSQFGQGSTFIVRLPRQPGKPPATA